MSYAKCSYRDCGNLRRGVSLFRFPVNDEGRLKLWILNSGNPQLDCLSNDELTRRFICSAHFPPSSISRRDRKSRLLGPAVPIKFKCDDSGTQPSAGTSGTKPPAGTGTEGDMEINGTGSPPDLLKVKIPTKFYSKRTKTNTASNRMCSRCLFEEGQQSEDLGNHVGFTCNSCYGAILGFRYSCVECVNFDLCARCETMREHDHHYMLRVPGPRPEGEFKAVMADLRAALQRRAVHHECEVEVKYEPGSDDEDIKPFDPLHVLIGDTKQYGSGVGQDVPYVPTRPAEDPPGPAAPSTGGGDQQIPALAAPSTSQAAVAQPRQLAMGEFKAVMADLRAALQRRAVHHECEVEVKYEPGSDDEDIKPFDPLNVPVGDTKQYGSGVGQDVPYVPTRPAEDPPGPAAPSTGGGDQQIPALAAPSTSQAAVAQPRQLAMGEFKAVMADLRAALQRRAVHHECEVEVKYEPGSDDEDIKPFDPLHVLIGDTKQYGSGVGQDVPYVPTRPAEDPPGPAAPSTGGGDQQIPALAAPSTSQAAVAQPRQLAMGEFKAVMADLRAALQRRAVHHECEVEVKYEPGSDDEDIKPFDPLHVLIGDTKQYGSGVGQDVPYVPTRPAEDPPGPAAPSAGGGDQQIPALAAPSTSQAAVAQPRQLAMIIHPLVKKRVRTKSRSGAHSKAELKAATEKRKSTSDQRVGDTLRVPFKMPKQEPLDADSGDTAERPRTAGPGSATKEDDFTVFTMHNKQDDDDEFDSGVS